VTDKGRALHDEALPVPAAMAQCVDISSEEVATLYRLLYKLLGVEKSVAGPAAGESGA
jgi:hypothetical protein